MQQTSVERESDMLRPSQLIAQALIERQNAQEFANRAQRIGMSKDTIRTVAHVCCCKSPSAPAVDGESSVSTSA